MANGFFGGIARQLLFWSGWVFTVAGAVASLWIGWIGLLVALVGLLTLTTFAYRKHIDKENADKEHETRHREWKDDLAAANRRALEAERKLNEVPYQTLISLQAVLAKFSYSEVLQLLLRRVGNIARLKAFQDQTSKPPNLRAFSRAGGTLFAIAKAEATSLSYLRPGDRFLLVKHSPSGVELDAAELILHQPPEPGKDVIMLRVANFLLDEMGHLGHLAESGDVQGLKGYGIKLAVDLDPYSALDLDCLQQGIGILLHQYESHNRGDL